MKYIIYDVVITIYISSMVTREVKVKNSECKCYKEWTQMAVSLGQNTIQALIKV